MMERFYADSINNDDLIDLIVVDTENKRYALHLNQKDAITDGEDEFGNEIFSTYVSRSILDIIIEGVKEKDFCLTNNLY